MLQHMMIVVLTCFICLIVAPFAQEALQHPYNVTFLCIAFLPQLVLW